MVKREKNGYMWVVKEKELKKRKKKEVKQIQIHNFYFSEFMWQNENEKDLFLVEPREGGEGLCTGGGVGVEWRNGEKNEKRKCRYNLTGRLRFIIGSKEGYGGMIWPAIKDLQSGARRDYGSGEGGGQGGVAGALGWGACEKGKCRYN